MTSVITGANGFVGRVLRARLEAAGDFVRALTRESVGDIADVRDWSPLVEGADVIYHLAARVHVMRETDENAAAAYRRTNVDATVALARAAARAGVRHFVFVSSVKAAAETSGDHPLREMDAPHPEDDYGRSKLEAEHALEALRSESAMHVTVIRPPLVYGPGVKANFYRLMQAVDHFVPLPLGLIRNRRSMIYVENLADAMIAASKAGEASSGTFYVSDAEDVSTPELVRRLARVLGRPALLLPVPPFALAAAGTLLGRRAAVDRLSASLAVETESIRRTILWDPPVTLDEGIRRTVAWYKSNR